MAARPGLTFDTVFLQGNVVWLPLRSRGMAARPGLKNNIIPDMLMSYGCC
jgi:hypothetical protein